MKKESCIFLLLLIVSLFNIGCDKDPVEDFTARPEPPPIIITPNPPTAYAGLDIWIAVPEDSAVLSASFSSSTWVTHQYLWKQVAGPNTALIKDKDSMRTSVTKLQKGTYEFEFTVTNIAGLWDKDTVSVFVQDLSLPSQAEVSFPAQEWACPMGCSLIIYCLPCYVPVNKSFKVYVKESITTPWLEVVPENLWTNDTKYSYYVDGGKLILYTNDEPPGKTDIKIVY